MEQNELTSRPDLKNHFELGWRRDAQELTENKDVVNKNHQNVDKNLLTILEENYTITI